MKQIPLDMSLELAPTLTSFFSRENTMAVGHMKLWLDTIYRGLTVPDPVYLWGPTGVGKTHILNAVYNDLREHGASVGWLNCFSNSEHEYNESWSAVLLDGADQFTPIQQSVAFNWFVNAKTFNAAVLSCGSVAPMHLAIRDDLRTRFGWGDIFQLHPLGENDSRNVLQQEAGYRGIVLHNDVVDFLMSRFSRDVASLKDLLTKIDRFSLETKRMITIPLIKLMLENSQ
jgi:DnaA-homolog protein